MSNEDFADQLLALIETVEELKAFDPVPDCNEDWSNILRYLGNRSDELTGMIEFRRDQTLRSVELGIRS